MLKVLFDLGHWHGFAKLRMHTDTTLGLLSRATVTLGHTLRTFQEQTCAAFQTKELQREQAARIQRRLKKVSISQPGPSNVMPQNHVSSVRLPKQLNLKTYKFHALGDYHDTIRLFGTIDSFSTQLVSLSR